MIHDTSERQSLPPGFAPAPMSEVVLLSDFWSPIPDFRRTLAQLSGAHARIHVIQVVDPAEETFPYSGRVEFLEPEGAGSVTAGRAETWRADYLEKLTAHRAAMREEAQRVQASFIIHRTDRPASELVLALHARMGEGGKAPAVAASSTAQAEAGA
jgi:uncharacterized protein (DUF58 family)